jgi:hypothetical protein
MARYGLQLSACNVGVHNSACVFWPGGLSFGVLNSPCAQRAHGRRKSLPVHIYKK